MDFDKHIIFAFIISKASYLRLGSEDFRIQSVGHYIAGWVPDAYQNVRWYILGKVYGRCILTPSLFIRAACWLHRAVGGYGGSSQMTDQGIVFDICNVEEYKVCQKQIKPP